MKFLHMNPRIERLKKMYKSYTEMKNMEAQEDVLSEASDIIDSNSSLVKKKRNFSESTSLPFLRNLLNKKKTEGINKLTDRLFREEMFSTFMRALPLNYQFKKANKGKIVKAFNTLLEETLTKVDKGKIHDLTSPEVVMILFNPKNKKSYGTDIYDTCKGAACDQIALDLANKSGLSKTDLPTDVKGLNLILNEISLTEDSSGLDPEIKNDFNKLTDTPKSRLVDSITNKVVNDVAKEKDEAQKRQEEEEQKADMLDKIDENDAKNPQNSSEDGISGDLDNSADMGTDIQNMEPEFPDQLDPSQANPETNGRDSPAAEAKDATMNLDSGMQPPAEGINQNPQTPKPAAPTPIKESYSIVPFSSKTIARYQKNKATNKYSLFKTIHLGLTKKYITENTELSESTSPTIKIDSDMIFAESLMYYTLLETFDHFHLLDTIDKREIRSHILSVIERS